MNGLSSVVLLSAIHRKMWVNSFVLTTRNPWCKALQFASVRRRVTTELPKAMAVILFATREQAKYHGARLIRPTPICLPRIIFGCEIVKIKIRLVKKLVIAFAFGCCFGDPSFAVPCVQAASIRAGQAGILSAASGHVAAQSAECGTQVVEIIEKIEKPDKPEQVVIVGPREVKEKPGGLISFVYSGNGQASGEGSGSAGVGNANTPSADNMLNPVSENNSDSGGCTQNPVIIATGEKFKSEDDFSSGGLYGMGLTRTYRSFNASGSMFGANWPSTFDSLKIGYTLTACRTIDALCYPRSATISYANGSRFKFT